MLEGRQYGGNDHDRTQKTATNLITHKTNVNPLNTLGDLNYIYVIPVSGCFFPVEAHVSIPFVLVKSE